MAAWLIAVIATTVLLMIVLVGCYAFCPEELGNQSSGRPKGMRRFRKNKCDSYHGDAEGEPIEIGNDDHWIPPCEEKGEEPDCEDDDDCAGELVCNTETGECEAEVDVCADVKCKDDEVCNDEGKCVAKENGDGAAAAISVGAALFALIMA